MSKITKPVDAIKHPKDTRLDIPTTEHAGEEAFNVADDSRTATYKTFRHEFTRGRDPELYWLGKYDNDDEDTQSPDMKVDIRSLYVHEDVQPEMLINNLYDLVEQKSEVAQLQGDLFSYTEFSNPIQDELEKVAEYYKHSSEWKNRLIQGDSLLVMNSLLKREGMAGKVQCIYIDPPYGIKYGSNWQMKLNSRDVKDNDQSLSGEPEMIKAFRDTWELGIHSYLSYLRDRLVVARELLTQSGSVFVQISDENVHLVRNLMDEVFGSENFCSLITFKKTSPLGSTGLAGISDYLIWYAKDIENVKYRQLFENKAIGAGSMYKYVELPDGSTRTMTPQEQIAPSLLPKGAKIFRLDKLTSSGYTPSCFYDFIFNGKIIHAKKKSWATNKLGMENLIKKNRVICPSDTPSFIRYHEDFPMQELNNLWNDTAGAKDIEYVVQTSTKVIQRCLLMTTDPGDLVLDPTCGGGTTAYVAEQWGRRWITMDTSRIALNIAKKRLTTAVYPYYELFDNESKDIRQGFVYKTVPHVTIKTLAQNEEPDRETLYDQPLEDKKRMRVAGPFTVETLQSYNIKSPEDMEEHADEVEENRLFQERIFSHLMTSGIRNGRKEEQAKFRGVEALASPYLHAKGYYTDGNGLERTVYFHIGPKFGTVSKQDVAMALQEFRPKAMNEGASWLVILGFSFEDNINDKDYNLGTYIVSKVRMHDDLMQDGLLKKDKGAGAFITIGEPDIEIVKDDDTHCHVEIRGLDIYDPIKDDVQARSLDQIAYWEIDDRYDNSKFVVRGIHFCGGDKKEFAAWKKGLEHTASYKTKKNAERTLKLVFNEEVWDELYSYRSEPLTYEPGRRVAVRVVSQFGEESTKVLTM
ncbi:MAG: site-specific DNA-methyltransferase [Bacteroidaceae bacterium]|nr:site-specific DNA-methyltransferase [Bacteroidaceae bacterium]